MDVQIRPIEPEELEAHMRAVEGAFGGHLEPRFVEFHRPFVEFDRTLAAFHGDAIVGGAAAMSFVMTVPGGELPVAGVTSVGVLPTHRRRGLNTALMRRQLDDVRERGEALAVLYASEGGIYGRFGYGPASFNASIDLETQRSAFGPWYRPSGSVRLHERDEALRAFLPVYDEVRRTRPGMMRIDERFFAYRMDERQREDEKIRWFFAGHETDGHVDGYAVYRVRHEWDVVPKSELAVEELLAVTPQAYADVWRYVLDVDLIRRVTAWNRPADEPLLHQVLEPRPLNLRLKDALWVRLVDIERALEARAYARAGSLVLEVRDAFCPWNEGRYRLEATGGGASCRRAEREPDLLLGVGELGAAYLGGSRLAALHRAGRVEERTAGALRLADEMFAWDPAPWCPFMF